MEQRKSKCLELLLRGVSREMRDTRARKGEITTSVVFATIPTNYEKKRNRLQLRKASCQILSAVK